MSSIVLYVALVISRGRFSCPTSIKSALVAHSAVNSGRSAPPRGLALSQTRRSILERSSLVINGSLRALDLGKEFQLAKATMLTRPKETCESQLIPVWLADLHAFSVVTEGFV